MPNYIFRHNPEHDMYDDHPRAIVLRDGQQVELLRISNGIPLVRFPDGVSRTVFSDELIPA